MHAVSQHDAIELQITEMHASSHDYYAVGQVPKLISQVSFFNKFSFYFYFVSVLGS